MSSIAKRTLLYMFIGALVGLLTQLAVGGSIYWFIILAAAGMFAIIMLLIEWFSEDI